MPFREYAEYFGREELKTLTAVFDATWKELSEERPVSTAYTLMSDVDSDPDLSMQGRQRKKHRIAMQAIADIQSSEALTQAQEVVKSVMAKWEQQVGMVLNAAHVLGIACAA